jgi:hypothetical protein
MDPLLRTQRLLLTQSVKRFQQSGFIVRFVKHRVGNCRIGRQLILTRRKQHRQLGRSFRMVSYCVAAPADTLSLSPDRACSSERICVYPFIGTSSRLAAGT